MVTSIDGEEETLGSLEEARLDLHEGLALLGEGSLGEPSEALHVVFALRQRDLHALVAIQEVGVALQRGVQGARSRPKGIAPARRGRVHERESQSG